MHFDRYTSHGTRRGRRVSWGSRAPPHGCLRQARHPLVPNRSRHRLRQHVLSGYADVGRECLALASEARALSCPAPLGPQPDARSAQHTAPAACCATGPNEVSQQINGHASGQSSARSHTSTARSTQATRPPCHTVQTPQHLLRAGLSRANGSTCTLPRSRYNSYTHHAERKKCPPPTGSPVRQKRPNAVP